MIDVRIAPGARLRTRRWSTSYPELAPLLATPCDFVIYHKDLPASP
jgi:hypothetical protein